MTHNPLDVINRNDSELTACMDKARDLAFADGELSKKSKLLIALAIDVACESENGIRSLATQALEHGATKAEISETLRIAHYICGVGSMYTAARALQDVM